METEIDKMKKHYDLKIEDCDTLINAARKSITLNRKGGHPDIVEEIKKQRDIKQAQRQAYVQAKYDFDSLLDYV